MRILALDVGEKRIGVAVTDELNITAQGIETITRRGWRGTINRIRSLIKEYDISKIAVGMPYNMDGTKGRSAKSVEEFVSLLQKEIPVETEVIDERLTTAQGERVLLESDASRKKRKGKIDRIAAQLILQGYLDSYVQKDRTK